ncbi:nif11-like leader peptide domain protein [Synechococcus sp. BIOS-U3-1]|uniref:Nif11-like leader peptide family RiPP precursor n=1 Tax=Synechococcus sp. BIOS-U3-1 TaxID=1400865 RepID=UPI001646A7E7|nr:Nif11-like leader peptide family RiPP precursor [Synechococcus sp. BIOS-U3-1]QNI58125.1 nif11-like leader peptide domain protein [Synechococcus sp. BIOS-U3-1]
MTQEQLNAILVKLEGDISLQEKIKSAKSTAEVVNTVKAEGFSVLADQLNLTARVSAEELEGVAGGLCSGNEWPCSN